MAQEHELGKAAGGLALRLSAQLAVNTISSFMPPDKEYQFELPDPGVYGLHTMEYGPVTMDHGIKRRRRDGEYLIDRHWVSIQRTHLIETAKESGVGIFKVSGRAWTALHIKNTRLGPNGARFSQLRRPTNKFRGCLYASKAIALPNAVDQSCQPQYNLDDVEYSYDLGDEPPEISRLANSGAGRRDQRVFKEWITAINRAMEWQKRESGR